MGPQVGCGIIDYCVSVTTFDDLEGTWLHQGISNHPHNRIGIGQVKAHIGRQKQRNGSLDGVVGNSLCWPILPCMLETHNQREAEFCTLYFLDSTIGMEDNPNTSHIVEMVKMR